MGELIQTLSVSRQLNLEDKYCTEYEDEKKMENTSVVVAAPVAAVVVESKVEKVVDTLDDDLDDLLNL